MNSSSSAFFRQGPKSGYESSHHDNSYQGSTSSSKYKYSLMSGHSRMQGTSPYLTWAWKSKEHEFFVMRMLNILHSYDNS